MLDCGGFSDAGLEFGAMTGVALKGAFGTYPVAFGWLGLAPSNNRKKELVEYRS